MSANYFSTPLENFSIFLTGFAFFLSSPLTQFDCDSLQFPIESSRNWLRFLLSLKWKWSEDLENILIQLTSITRVLCHLNIFTCSINLCHQTSFELFIHESVLSKLDNWKRWRAWNDKLKRHCVSHVNHNILTNFRQIKSMSNSLSLLTKKGLSWTFDEKIGQFVTFFQTKRF